MTMMIKQLPLALSGTPKGEARTQFAALCYRIRDGKVQVLMVTSRRSKSWIIPKGWPMDRKTPAASAAQEAWEEAGVRGRPDGRCLGLYFHNKVKGRKGVLPTLVLVYAVQVKTVAKKFPERGQRKRKWMSRKQAATLVKQPELARILRDFDPRAGF